MDESAIPNRHRPRRAEVFAWLRLARVFQKITSRSERFFRARGLNTAQFDVLAHIGAAEALTQQELAASLLVTKGNVSQLVCKMEQTGLVRRQQEDGRTKSLSLTDEGRLLFEQVVPANEELIAELLAPLSADEQRELLRLLRKLDQRLEA